MSILKHPFADNSKLVAKISIQSPLLATTLARIADPPRQLFYRGDITLLKNHYQRPKVAIVGSRKITPYGKRITIQLARDLARQGVIIVSGLAFGVDSLAHRTALESKAPVIAVLPSSLTDVYPASHQQLAQQIVKQGGLLVSEYMDSPHPMKYQFIARNRLIAGLSRAVLITEAAQNSGSLHTAGFAMEQGIPVLAVPGNIDSLTSVGTNKLIKEGAHPVTSAQDVFELLGFKITPKVIIKGDNPAEDRLLRLIQAGQQDAGQLLRQSQLEPAVFNQTLTMLEISGKIRSAGAGLWTLS